MMPPPFQFKSMQGEDEEEKKPTIQKKSKPNGMPENVQTKMENAFGQDFSNVNIHTNSSSSKDMGALAYAQGNDVHFASGQYNPQSQKGQELIGHELTHVVQQREGRVKPTTQTKGMPVNNDKGLEKEADDMGRKVSQMKNDPAAKPQKTPFQLKGIKSSVSQRNAIQGRFEISTIQRKTLTAETDSPPKEAFVLGESISQTEDNPRSPYLPKVEKKKEEESEIQEPDTLDKVGGENLSQDKTADDADQGELEVEDTDIAHLQDVATNEDEITDDEIELEDSEVIGEMSHDEIGEEDTEAEEQVSKRNEPEQEEIPREAGSPVQAKGAVIQRAWYDNIGKKIANTARSVVDKGKNVVNKGKKAVGSLVNKGKKTVGSLVKKGKNAVGSAASWAGENLLAPLGSVLSGGKKVVGALASNAEEAWEQTNFKWTDAVTSMSTLGPSSFAFNLTQNFRRITIADAADAARENPNIPDFIPAGLEGANKGLDYFTNIGNRIFSARDEMLEGALLGDFKENPTIFNTIGQIAMGFVPYAGQVADVRDLVAGVKKLHENGWKDPWDYFNIVLIGVGFIPGLGDIVKAGGRASKKPISKMLRVIKEKGGDLWKGAMQRGEKLVDGARILGSGLYKKAKGAGENLMQGAKDFGHKVMGGARSVGDRIMGGISSGRSTLRNLGNNAISTGRSVLDRASGLIRRLPQVIRGRAENLLQGGKSFVKGAMNKVKSGLARGRSIFNNLRNKVAQKMKEAKSVASNAMQKAITKGKSLFQKAKEMAAEGLQKMKDRASSLFKAGVDRARNAYNQGKIFVKEKASGIISNLLGRVRKKLREFMERLKGGGDNAAESVDDLADDIPTDSRTLMDNAFDESGALRPNSRFRQGEFDYFSETDELGRLSKVETDNLQQSTVDRLRHEGNTPGKIEGDHAGHMLADRFGGSPGLDNLTSQLSNLNLSGWKKMENAWGRALAQGQSVAVDIRINYNGSSTRPSSFDVSYTVNNGRIITRTFNNVSE